MGQNGRLKDGVKIPERLVVRGVNWLGDAVMSMPALTRLREALPNCHIALLTDEKLAGLWQDHAAINQVIPFTKANGVGQVSQKLRAGCFDTALIFPNSFRSAIEPWMAGIRTRVGYAGNGRKLLLSEAIAPRAEHIEMHKRSPTEIKNLVAENPQQPRQAFPRSGHHLYQYLKLVSHFGASEQPLPPTIRIGSEEAAEFRQKFDVAPDRTVIGLNPGAEYGPAKRWPLENFTQAAVRVTKQLDPTWLVFGGGGDVPTGNQLSSAIQQEGGTILNLAGMTTLRELAVGLSVCEAVLTNDTGPMHLAAAVGTRVVVPFGSTSPELTGPGLPGDSRHRLLLGNVACAPCFLRVCPIDFRCMKAITVESVANAILGLVTAKA